MSNIFELNFEVHTNRFYTNFMWKVYNFIIAILHDIHDRCQSHQGYIYIVFIVHYHGIHVILPVHFFLKYESVLLEP